MGNASSTNLSSDDSNSKKEFKNFYDIIDYIASYYILTLDFQILKKLSEKAYCDKLVVLTSDIIKNNFTDMEVTYLAQRIKDGKEINMLDKQDVTFISTDQLNDLDISNDSKKKLKKKRICIGIAKHYIKIAHLFSAIVMTINPVYTYKDQNGKTVKAGLMEKDLIPKNIPRTLYKVNICDNRIRALKRGQDESTIHPKVCNINKNKNGDLKTLEEEPGIPELMQLYLDDEYDYSNGTFKGMSLKTQKIFKNDLSKFYKAFTGNEVMPENVTKFSDIKLRDYSQKPGCMGANAKMNKSVNISHKDKLFQEYAENIQDMINNAVINQRKLLSVINNIFVFKEDPYTKIKKIKINPKLTSSLLQENILKTRKYISNLYITCELDYIKGIKIFEAIVESQILESTQNQIENLTNEKSELIKNNLSNISSDNKIL